MIRGSMFNVCGSYPRTEGVYVEVTHFYDWMNHFRDCSGDIPKL